MLRHLCGYYLADRGTILRTMQDYLGHRDPRHTVHYTRVSGCRFEGYGNRCRQAESPEVSARMVSDNLLGAVATLNPITSIIIDLDDGIGDFMRCAKFVDRLSLTLEKIIVVGDQCSAN